MRKRGVFIFLICILFLQFVVADTTFFEGELGYRDDFVMGAIEEGVLPSESEEETAPSGGGLNKELVCSAFSDALRGHLIKYQDIDYTSEEVETLKINIKEEIGVSLSTHQVNVLVENFEDECSAPIPLLGGFAAGRYRNLFDPIIIITAVLVLSFFIFLYFMLRRLRNLKKRKSSKKRKKRRKK